MMGNINRTLDRSHDRCTVFRTTRVFREYLEMPQQDLEALAAATRATATDVVAPISTLD